MFALFNNSINLNLNLINVSVELSEFPFAIILYSSFVKLFFIVSLEFSGTIEAMKFVTKVTDAITNKTLTDRSFDKVKETFDKVDDVLGFDTRGTVKGVLENGIGRTLFKGIGIGKSKSTKKKKKNT